LVCRFYRGLGCVEETLAAHKPTRPIHSRYKHIVSNKVLKIILRHVCNEGSRFCFPSPGALYIMYLRAGHLGRRYGFRIKSGVVLVGMHLLVWQCSTSNDLPTARPTSGTTSPSLNIQHDTPYIADVAQYSRAVSDIGTLRTETLGPVTEAWLIAS
jgi:hypothetical protein